MKQPKVLVAAIVGTRPAVVHATATPLLTELCCTAHPDILLAATTGPSGSARFLDRLRNLDPLRNLRWLSPVLFSSDNEWDAACTELLNHFQAYDQVFLLLKSGKGVWLEQLVYTINTAPSASTHYTYITSDGRDTILMDRSLQPLRQLPLASLGLERFLALTGLQASGVDRSGTLRNGVLQREEDNSCQLPFLMLTEQSGFLYIAIYAESWLAEEKYQIAFRQFMGRCQKLGLERGRILMVIPKNRDKAHTLKTRARELALATLSVEVDDQYERILSRNRVVRQLREMAEAANPRDTTQPGNFRPAPHVSRQTGAGKELFGTLLMAVSGTDSDVNLLAISSHQPRRVILCYDKTSNDTTVAAARLQQLLMDNEDLHCEEVVAVATDQMGWGLKGQLASLRRQGTGPWDINLTPGTKDQAFALLLTADEDDRIWLSDSTRKCMVILGEGGQTLPWRYPALRHTAAHLGGQLQDSGVVVTKAMISEDARVAVHNLFTHLAAINWTGPLSAATGSDPARDTRPISDENGVMIIRDTGERLILADLFPWFNFTNQDGSHDSNLWLEPCTALCLVEAGADEVVCNMKWSWGSGLDHDNFRDELDIVARFAEQVVAISCKTNPGQGERREKHLWEIDTIATTFFGRFAKPVLACPQAVSEQQTSDVAGPDAASEKPAYRTRVIGAQHLARAETLQSVLLADETR